MKNVHLIPTDKPSRLCYDKSDNLLFAPNAGFSTADGKQHIYITSDEEIKEGINQWYLDKFINKPRNSSGSQYGEKQDVIILTTDQDLIKDGVQAIDDEFLEWFVKNPSCEEVEVVDNLKYFNVDELRERHLKGLSHLYSEKIGYKIIIPKEEPKQLNPEYFGLPKLGTKEFNDLASAYFGGKPRQETLEEVAKKYAESTPDNDPVRIKSFIKGAEWQEERMYSEEEVEQLIHRAVHDSHCRPNRVKHANSNECAAFVHEWVEQFKKK